MTGEEWRVNRRCLQALLGRDPTPAEWARFDETWQWLEAGSGKPDPGGEAWQRWRDWLWEKYPDPQEE